MPNLSMLRMVPFRVYEYAVILLAVAVGVGWYTAVERSIGRKEVTEALEKAHAQEQAQISAEAERQNAKIDARFNAHDFKPIDYTLPADCGEVPDAVRNAVNAAHH